MLPFKNRLVKRKDFEKIQRNGSFFSDANVSIKFIPNGTEETRVGFIVGLKFSKKSVERNLIKRQLREILKVMLKRKELKKGFDISVVARKRESEKIKFFDLERNVHRVFEKSGLLS